MAALNVDYIAWIIILEAINSNLSFIFDVNYCLWKFKTSKRQGVSSFLETKLKVFRFKTKPIPRMSGRDAKILVTNAQLTVVLATVVILEPRKIWAVFVFKFWGLWGS